MLLEFFHPTRYVLYFFYLQHLKAPELPECYPDSLRSHKYTQDICSEKLSQALINPKQHTWHLKFVLLCQLHFYFLQNSPGDQILQVYFLKQAKQCSGFGQTQHKLALVKMQ